MNITMTRPTVATISLTLASLGCLGSGCTSNVGDSPSESPIPTDEVRDGERHEGPSFEPTGVEENPALPKGPRPTPPPGD